jgi:hypothetical protein
MAEDTGRLGTISIDKIELLARRKCGRTVVGDSNRHLLVRTDMVSSSIDTTKLSSRVTGTASSILKLS